MQRFLEQHPHMGDLRVGGNFGMIGAALAHHIETQYTVGHLRADVHDFGHRVQNIEVLGEGLPVETYAFGQHRARNVFHALHEIDQVRRGSRAHRGKADSAVAEDDRGHAVPGRWRKIRIPGDLAVVVGVDVDESRSNQHAPGVDFAVSTPYIRAYPADGFSIDRDVGFATRRASAVDNHAAANNQIMHVVFPPDASVGRLRC